MKTITVPFLPGERVHIKELNCSGHVEQIAIAQDGVNFKVSYWHEGNRKDCWVPGYELGEKE